MLSLPVTLLISAHSHFLTPISSPWSFTWSLLSAFFLLLWIYFKVLPPIRWKKFLCHPQRYFPTFPFPMLPGQTVPSCSSLIYLLLLLPSPVPCTRTASHIKKHYLYSSRHHQPPKICWKCFSERAHTPHAE